MNNSKAKERQANAQTYINLCLEKEPNNIDALILLGRIKEKEGEYDESYEAFKKALTQDNKRPQAYFYLGQLFEKRKETKNAINAYKQ